MEIEINTFLISINYLAQSDFPSLTFLVFSVQLIVGILIIFILKNSMSIIGENWFNFEDDFIFEDDDEEFLKDNTFIELVENVETKFSMIAGNDEAKMELQEVVKFLKEPGFFSILGAKLPKGVILSGPPGTGKTLFARAVAGEANLPFIQVSGSQFVELLVGTGAARMSELFSFARDVKPCIIFIDEIDSIARARSSNSDLGGVNDEREQTLNQLLTEMDGFRSESEIVVIAATNRIDILDPALIRPGRFDRQIAITLPNIDDREAILKVHAKGKNLDESVSFGDIAVQTMGFSGADLENLLNEAAILAVRRQKKTITMDEIFTTMDRITLGVEGTGLSRIKAKQLDAFRQVGQAVMSIVINPKQSIKKLTLIPRENIAGMGNLASTNILYPSREDFLDQIVIALTGLAVETLINGQLETTAFHEEELAQASDLLKNIVLRYAMSKLQNIDDDSEGSFFDSSDEISYETRLECEDFSIMFVRGAYTQILSFLEHARPLLEKIVDELIVKEEVSENILRYLAKEYLSYIEIEDLLFDVRAAKIFQRLFPGILESPIEIRKESDNVIIKIKNILLNSD